MLCRWLYLLILPLLLLVAVDQAHSATIAVFPIEDLTQGSNGVNREVTEYLAWDLNQRGLDVVAPEAIMDFMARNKVRWLGFLDTRFIIMAKEELGADLVIFGTMSLRAKELSPSLGLTLYLVRTEDTRTIWTGSGGLSEQDIVNFLAIGEEDEKKGLMARLVKDVLQGWPSEFESFDRQQHALELESVDFGPEYVRRGDEVKCSVRLRTKWSDEDMPRVFFKAAGRVHLAQQSMDGFQYASAWTVKNRDGRYPVTMVISWPSGYKKVAFLGAYSVDSSPPKLVLDLKGVQLEGTVAFRDQVIIIPRFLRREPVARWKLTIEDENGEEQMSRVGYGQLPRRFVWTGKGKDGWPVEEGVYQVSLRVWDRADNMALSSQPVAVARTPPSLVLEAKNRGRDMIVDLSHEGKVPIAFWRMEMRTSGGETIKVAEGSELPVRIDVEMPGRNRAIKVAEDLRKVIKVAEGQDASAEERKKIIKVADSLRKVIKVAEGLTPPAEDRKKIIKVAEDGNRKVIKVAGGPLQVDSVNPEDKDKRKVELSIVIRDVLGNLTKKKIEDIASFVEELGRKEAAEKPKPVWLDEF